MIKVKQKVFLLTITKYLLFTRITIVTLTVKIMFSVEDLIFIEIIVSKIPFYQTRF